MAPLVKFLLHIAPLGRWGLAKLSGLGPYDPSSIFSNFVDEKDEINKNETGVGTF